MTGMMKENT